MKRYKTKMSRELAVVLLSILNDYHIDSRNSIADKLLAAILMEVTNDLARKLADRFKREVSINWRPYEALAMQLFFLKEIDMSRPAEFYTLKMMKMCGEIDQLFA